MFSCSCSYYGISFFIKIGKSSETIDSIVQSISYVRWLNASCHSSKQHIPEVSYFGTYDMSHIQNPETILGLVNLIFQNFKIYLKTSVGGLFGFFLKTISVLLFFHFLQRKQFVCFEPYFSFIECAAQKGHRGNFLDI